MGVLLTLLLFHTNKHNHDRYGSWYVHQIRNRESLQRGDGTFFSVQSQARYNLQIAVDQRVEQSLYKDAKIVGGVRGFCADNDAVTKPENWILCCKCATSGNSTMSTNAHGLHRSWSQINGSQMLLQFWRMSMSTDIALDRTMLINLRSGSETEIPTKLLNLQQDGIIITRVSPRTTSIIQNVFWSYS